MTAPYNKEMNLNAWASMFKDIYFPTQNYNRSKLDIFAHLVKVYGGGSRFLFRTNNPDASKEYLAKIFGWYCALAIRLNIDIETALWSKYPNMCPRCQQAVCNCDLGPLKEIDSDHLKLSAEKNKHLRPETLRQWQTLFSGIYRNPVKSLPKDRLASVFSRMAEELGEVAEAMLLDDVIDHDVRQVVENEMADLCAWIFALANSLHLVDPQMDGIMLADVAWNLYGGACHRCKKCPCACVAGTFGLELAGRGAMGPAHWDELTGMANASGMKVKLAALDKQFKQDQTMDISIVMLDLDDFGLVNKKHGNHAGDEILRETATRIAKTLAGKAIAFRRGGEEFVVTSAVGMEDAQIQAERIRAAIASTPIAFNSAAEGEISLTITASFGVASTSVDRVLPSALEKIADDRMRQAKADGKNRVRPPLSGDAARNFIAKGELYN